MCSCYDPVFSDNRSAASYRWKLNDPIPLSIFCGLAAYDFSSSLNTINRRFTLRVHRNETSTSRCCHRAVGCSWRDNWAVLSIFLLFFDYEFNLNYQNVIKMSQLFRLKIRIGLQIIIMNKTLSCDRSY